LIPGPASQSSHQSFTLSNCSSQFRFITFVTGHGCEREATPFVLSVKVCDKPAPQPVSPVGSINPDFPVHSLHISPPPSTSALFLPSGLYIRSAPYILLVSATHTHTRVQTNATYEKSTSSYEHQHQSSNMPGITWDGKHWIFIIPWPSVADLDP
jgi:hypothetical protein